MRSAPLPDAKNQVIRQQSGEPDPSDISDFVSEKCADLKPS